MKVLPIIVLMCLFLWGCSSDRQDMKSVKVFHYNQPNRITSLDPAFAKSQNNMWAIHHLFNTLLTLDQDLNLVPALAKSYEVSEDGLTYTFLLRTDVLFHDNDCFTSTEQRTCIASDVVYSFERIVSDELYSPGSWIFSDKIADTEPFKALNDSTFVLSLKKPFLPMLNILTMQYCSVMSEKAVEYYGKAVRNNPVGTGPFQFKRWLENQGLYLIKNDQYWEYRDDIRLPYLDGVRTSFMEDKKIAFLELLNGKVECVSGLESAFINEMLDSQGELQKDKEETISLYKSPYLNTEYLGFQQDLVKGTALENKLVRQALNYAIDKETMLQSLRNNIGHAADSGIIPRGLPSHDVDSVPGYTYDLEKARQLLVLAGYPNGEGVEPISISSNQDYLDLTTFVAKQWEKLGIEVNIDLMESASLREGMRKASLPVFRASWIADYPDGESFLCLFYSGYPAPPNYTQFDNSEYDRLYELAIKEVDPTKRTSLYHEMNRIVVDESPVIFLFYDESALFTRSNIKGIETNALNLLQVKQIQE